MLFVKLTTITMCLLASLTIASAQTSKDSASTNAAISKSETPSGIGDWKNGEQLFIGLKRFQNNGPTCNSCHNVNMKNIITGGALAKDLTQAVSRLTETGVKGIIEGMPFPQMKQSFEGKELTASEVTDLTAFLVYSNDLAMKSLPTNTIGSSMIYGGVGGVVLLLVLFSIFWIRRKQRAVNDTIYSRQIKSS